MVFCRARIRQGTILSVQSGARLHLVVTAAPIAGGLRGIAFAALLAVGLMVQARIAVPSATI